MRARGADYSSYQTLPTVSASVHANELAFAFVKTTQGLEYVNPLARQQLQLLEQNARCVGLYHFLTHDVDGARQWDHFEATLHWARRPLVACDQESDNGVLVPDAIARAFIRRGRQRGYLVGRYGDARVMGRRLGESWRWYARWAMTPPAGKWDFWQYAAGAHGAPDWNVFRGDVAELERFWNAHTDVPTRPRRTPPLRWWLHDEHEKRALGPYLLPELAAHVVAYIARHPHSRRFELVRK
jgi:GH25 family lysozyme M1 (1,4-beta-N-acetylmuramidase)